MIKFIKTLSIFFLLSMFIGNNTSFSQTAQPKQNCTYKNASVFFSNPTLILSKYSPEYFCTDIVYLEKNNLGNISLSEYKKLYTTASSNFNYLRSLGITPDILNEYLNNDELEDEEKINFSDNLTVNNLIKTLIVTAQIGADFTITPAQSFSFEASKEDFENSDEFTGSIVNSKGKNCITDKRLSYSSNDGIYTPKTLTYFDVMSALPIAIRPVAIKGNKLVNMQGNTMATIEFNTSIGGNVISQGIGKSSIRKITFDNDYQRQTSVNVNWNEKKCKTDTLEASVAKSSVCFMCPYIVMLFDEISMLFDYMYNTFAKYIIIFMVLFGCFYFLTSFLKGFKNAPFEVNTNNFFADIVERLKLIFIVATVLLVPVGYLFSFTFEPIMNLTLGVADKVISVENTKSTCNPNTVFDEIRQRKLSKQEEQVIPPVVKLKQIEMQKNTDINYVLSKQTVGSLVCFLTDTINTNGKQMVMGKVLMKNLFNFKSDNKILSFFIGIIIWGLFFIINFMISFYILDGLIDILKIAILWPFMVFGYAFNWIGFNIISSIVDTAKNFGFTMITLAVFSLFNRTLIYSFYFKNNNESVLGILDRAIAENNPDIILNAIPTDIISVSSFAFIIYAMYYVYSKLSEFASSYGGSIGSITLGNNLKNTFKSILGLKIQREEKEPYSKKTQSKSSDKFESEETTSVNEETEITNE
ncbi:hypothetical protein HDR60_05815 [bacterium]|nr:hypothetical protein [bacterium]